jgi:hypothetical protein
MPQGQDVEGVRVLLDKLQFAIGSELRDIFESQFSSLRSQMEGTLRGQGLDHDNIIRLQETSSQVLRAIEVLTQDLNRKHIENQTKMDALAIRVEILESTKWKLVGALLVMSFAIPLAVSLAVRFWPTRP